MTPAKSKAYREKRAAFWRKKQEAKGLAHWRGKEWVTKEEFEKRYQAALELGRQANEEYRARLISIYGSVPAWAPHYVRR